MSKESQIYIGNQMRKARVNAGKTQEWLGEQLGVGAAHVSNLERGNRRITNDVLLKLCEIFDKSSDYFMAGAQYSNNIPEKVVMRIKAFDDKKLMLLEKYVEMLDDLEL